MGEYQEPWRPDPKMHYIADKNGGWVVMTDCQKGIESRIIACVNACEGITTEALNINGAIPKPIDANQKGNPKSYHIITINNTQIRVTGWHRKDLEAQHKGWHYYESLDGRMYHFRSEHMVAVEEGEVEE